MNSNFFFWGGVERDRLHFGKEMLLCAREVCSSHCPLAHTDTHYILTPSLKPISFAQGMGTPLLSLLPLSPLPPYHLCPLLCPLSCCPLSTPLLYFSPSHPHLVLPSLGCFLWCPFFPRGPPVLLSGFFLRVSSPHLFYFLPPSAPNLSQAVPVFFPDNLFLIPQN